MLLVLIRIASACIYNMVIVLFVPPLDVVDGISAEQIRRIFDDN